MRARGRRARRVVDMGAAAVLSVFLVPVAGVVAVAVAVTSGGPVLFRQRRSGLHGREFSIIKFRTMRDESHSDDPDASRATRVGTLLRWSSLDEIPQLWNIVVGEMSFIGPRPTLPEQVARYDDRQRGRLAVLPGITGWAQVNGRNSLSWPDRIELDLWYIEHRSLGLDARILARTIKNLLRPTGVVGAGGVNPDFPPRADPPGPDPCRAAPAGPVPRAALDAPTVPMERV